LRHRGLKPLRSYRQWFQLWIHEAENRLTSVISGTLTETYTYDADSERLSKVTTVGAASSTTICLNNLWEETLDGAVKRYYALNGQTIAVRDSAMGDAVSYLHGDQLGSVGLATTTSGQASAQFFKPWGTSRGGGIGATSLNFTRQHLDSTGLLYYHARYYDPALARFLSPDTVTADPGDPQQLNRYSYVRNNPVRYNDPSGHCLGWLWGATDCRLARSMSELDWEGALDNVQTGLDVAGMIPVAGEALDLANAGISAARGNYGEAALSLAAMAPLGGQAAGIGKLTVKRRQVQALYKIFTFYTLIRNLPLEKPKKYAIVALRFGLHEVPRMLCPLQAHSRELIVNPKPSIVYWFQEWIAVDPKEQGER